MLNRSGEAISLIIQASFRSLIDCHLLSRVCPDHLILNSKTSLSQSPNTPSPIALICTQYHHLSFLFLFSSVKSLSRVQLFVTPWTAARQASLSTPAPGVYSNSCPLSRWCHPTLSSSVVPFSHLQSFPASGSLPMSQFFASGGQSIGVSASASVLPMKIQDWFRWGWTGWISLQSKGLSRVFSNTII